MKLYIDPGTGSMLFAALIGIIGALRYLIKLGIAKLKYRTSGKKDTSLDTIPFVIYSDDKRYWSIFEPIIKELDNKDFKVVYYTQSEDDKAFNADYKNLKVEFIGEGNKGFSRLNYLKATLVLSTTPGLDVYQWKRSKDVKYYLHILHSPVETCTYRMFGLDFYDGLFVSGKYQEDDIRYLEKIRNLPPKDICMMGVPYLDEMKKRLESTPKDTSHEITVLLAPSWGPSAILSRFGEKIIDELINTGYKIIVRPHPQSFTSEKDMIDKLMNKYPSIEWNKDSDNFDVLNRSDIMISDFSGVIFDFSLVFDKPVILTDTKFDNSIYDAWWLDHDLWSFTIFDKLGEKLDESSFSNLKELIDNSLNNPKYSKGREEVRNTTWVNEGKGAKIASEFIINKYNELIEGETK